MLGWPEWRQGWHHNVITELSPPLCLSLSASRHLIAPGRAGKFLVRTPRPTSPLAHLSCPDTGSLTQPQPVNVILQPPLVLTNIKWSPCVSVIMSTESLHSSTTTTSFTGDIDSYLDKIGSKAPQSWRKPRSRMYDYNRTLGYEYYQVSKRAKSSSSFCFV